LLKLSRLDAKREWRSGQLAHGEENSGSEVGSYSPPDPQVLLWTNRPRGMPDDETTAPEDLPHKVRRQTPIVVVGTTI